MSSSKKVSEEDLSSFCAVTGASVDRARFYIEAANGDLDLAIESFYEGNHDDDADMQPTERKGPKFQVEKDDDDDDDDEDEDASSTFPKQNPFAKLQQELTKSKETKPLKPNTSGSSSKIFTLSSFANNDDSNPDHDDDEEKGQAFYAGGSETSGQQILGPPKKNPEKIIKDLFEKAKEAGAQVVDSSESSEQHHSKISSTSYATGYRLGTGNEPSEVIPGKPKPKQPKISVLKLWKNGFNIDDGAIRSYDDEKNKEFLGSIQRGELPKELIRQAEGGEVHLDMQDHRDEEFVPPKPQYRLYNEGYKLGSPTPTVVSNASPNDQVANEQQAKKNLNIDESKPTTQIQIRLSDGSRLIIKANQSNTISDLRRYINTARPEYSSRVYSLLTSFPNKELENEGENLEQAKLINAVIIQKLKA